MLNDGEKRPETSEPPEAEKKRDDGSVKYIYSKSSKRLNQIKAAYIELVKENQGAIPTYQDIAKRCHISSKQVQRHYKNIDFASEFNELFKIFIPEVTHAVLVQARKGNVPAAKLFYQFVADWKEKSDFDMKVNGEVFPVPNITVNVVSPDKNETNQ